MDFSDDELVQAAARVKGLLNLLHEMAHTEEHGHHPEGHSVVAHTLHDHDLLELMNEYHPDAFEDYKDLAQHLFHQVYLQMHSIAELTRTDVCGLINWQLDNVEREIGRWN